MKNKIFTIIGFTLLVLGVLFVIFGNVVHAAEVREYRYNSEDFVGGEPTRATITTWSYDDTNLVQNEVTPVSLDALVAWNNYADDNGLQKIYITSSSDSYNVTYYPSSTGWTIPHIYTQPHYNSIRVYMPADWINNFNLFYIYSSLHTAVNITGGTVSDNYKQFSLDNTTLGDGWCLGGSLTDGLIYAAIAGTSVVEKTLTIQYNYTLNGSTYLVDSEMFSVNRELTEFTVPFPVNANKNINGTNFTGWAVQSGYWIVSLTPSLSDETIVVPLEPLENYVSSLTWYRNAIDTAYAEGMNAVAPLGNGDLSFSNMIFAVVTSPIAFIASAFEFTIFGIPIVPTLLGIVTIVLIVFVIKKVKGA